MIIRSTFKPCQGRKLSALIQKKKKTMKMKFHLIHTTKPSSDSVVLLCSSNPRNCSALIPLSTAVTTIFPSQKKKNWTPRNSKQCKWKQREWEMRNPIVVFVFPKHTHLYKLRFWANAQWPFDQRGCHRRPKHEPLGGIHPWERDQRKRHCWSPSLGWTDRERETWKPKRKRGFLNVGVPKS